MKCRSLERCPRYLTVLLGGNCNLVYYEAFGLVASFSTRLYISQLGIKILSCMCVAVSIKPS